MWKKRVLAIFMAVLMAFSLLPSMVFAAQPSGELSGKLKIKGKAEVGSTLSADLKKVKPEGITEESVSFQWSIKSGEELTEISTDATYLVAAEDQGAEIVLTITGKEEVGVTGSLKASTGVVAAEGEGVEESQEETSQEEEVPLEEQENLGNTDGMEEPEEEGVIKEEDPDVQMEEELGQSQLGNEEEVPQEEVPQEEEITYTAEAHTEDGTGVLDFGTVWDGEEETTEPQYVYVQNTGSGSLTFEGSSPEYFMVQDIEGTLEPGDGVSLWVQPREGLEPGVYEDTITYTTIEGGSASVQAMVTIAEKAEEPTPTPENTYAIRVEPTELNFAALTEGYEDPGEAQTVLVYNDSQTEVTLKMPQKNYFDVSLVGEGNTEQLVLSPGVSYAFKIRPVTGLTLGSYQDDLVFGIQENEDVKAVTTAYVEVKKAEIPQFAVKADPKSADFGTGMEGDENLPEAKAITLTNTGTDTVTLIQPKGNEFQIGELSAETLEPGSSAVFTVQPKSGLAAGEYTEKISVLNAADSTELASVSVSWKVEKKEETYSLNVTPDMLDFGTREVGYESAPKAQTVTVTNTGTGTIVLTKPDSDHFQIGELSAEILEAGQSASFTVQPKKGLEESEYLEVIEISNDAGVQALTNAYFSVEKASVKLEAVQKFKEITGIANGVEKSAKGLKLPGTAVIRTSKGKAKAKISWNVKDCAYNPANVEKQTFTVNGKISLPKGVSNPDGISQKVSVQVSVNAYEPKLASADKNYISGIKAEGYTTESKITFTAVGAGMDNETPRKGDTRFVPLNWTVLNTNSWSSAPYTASFGISQNGNYTLSVVYNQQKFDGSNWVNTGVQDTKKAGFRIGTAAQNKVTPGANQKQAVKTGDHTPIMPFVIALIAAVLVGAGVMVYRKKR